MDLYRKMGSELRSLFADLFDPAKEAIIRQKMKKIVSLAHQIGPSLGQEADRLNADVARFLENPQNLENISRMKNHALKLEQETREL